MWNNFGIIRSYKTADESTIEVTYMKIFCFKFETFVEEQDCRSGRNIWEFF